MKENDYRFINNFMALRHFLILQSGLMKRIKESSIAKS